jgi:hypothetical protein
MTPLGYDTKERKITINEAEADRVRDIFRSYLKLGSLNLLMADLRKRGMVTKARILKTGQAVGGIPFTRGPLAHLLRNRFYIREVAFKGEVLPGEQPAIVDKDLFEAVQARLGEQINNHKTTRMKSEALLAGRIFDDGGNRMGHARKRGTKYRYYISTALVQGQGERVGTVGRVPANEIETLVVKSVRDHLHQPIQAKDDTTLIRDHVVRVEVPWQKTPSTRRREILLPESVASQIPRPIRSESRTLLVASIARGRRWLEELTANPSATAETIAVRECCSIRKVNMTISLAFLAPDLVKAAIEGRLPHGMGVARLCELPAEWSRQHVVLGLRAPGPDIRT